MALTKINNNTLSAITGLPAGVGGKVLQVVTATDSTQRSTTSTSYVTGSNTLSVNITPSATSSKILLLLSTGIQGSNGVSAYYTIYRDATNIGGTNGFFNYNNAARESFTTNYLDSPNSTSQLTYQLYFKMESSTAYININSAKSSLTAIEIGA
jgi:hypothetical protein